MRNIVKNIGIVFCLFLVVFSSTSLRWEGHYCKEELKSYTFFGNAALCDMANQSESCHKKKVCPFHKNKTQPSKTRLNKKSCCTNIDFVFSGFEFEENQTVQHLQCDIPMTKVFWFEQFSIDTGFELEKIVKPPPPPDIEWNYQERFEVYLI